MRAAAPRPIQLYEEEVPVDRHGYMTNLLGDRAVRRSRATRRSQQPFLLSLHFTAPHWPWEGPDDEAESKRIRNILHHDGGTQKTYGKMVQSLDANIGRVLQALDTNGLSANTIVVFTSDNGGERFSKIWPFTGMKGELLEGGVRIPAIVRWPGHIAAGSVSDQPMITMDWLPTLVAAAGTRPDPAYPSDGEDLAPALRRRGRASAQVLLALQGGIAARGARRRLQIPADRRQRIPVRRRPGPARARQPQGSATRTCSTGSRAIGRHGTPPCWRSGRGRHATGNPAISRPTTTASSIRRRRGRRPGCRAALSAQHNVIC